MRSRRSKRALDDADPGGHERRPQVDEPDKQQDLTAGGERRTGDRRDGEGE
jgi:hypothetical protein